MIVKNMIVHNVSKGFRLSRGWRQGGIRVGRKIGGNVRKRDGRKCNKGISLKELKIESFYNGRSSFHYNKCIIDLDPTL